MGDELSTLRAFLADVSGRRSTLAWRRGWTTGAAAAALALAATRGALDVVAPTGGAFVLLVALGALVATSALVVALRAARVSSTDLRLARLVEERFGGLDDVVVTAVDYAARADHAPVMANRLAASAMRAVSAGGADRVVAQADLTYAGRTALGAAVALALAVAFFVGPAADAARVVAAHVVPSQFQIRVEPGNVRIRAGGSVTIVARVLGGAAPLTPSFVAGEGPDAAPVPMTPAGEGAFAMTLADVSASFTYRVRAGGLRSGDFTVTVVRPPAVERIDLDYAFPPALRLAPRREDDGGDIYAPEGTTVRLTVTADRAVHASALVLGDGTRVPLGVDGRLSTGDLQVRADGSYRVALVEDDGVETAGDTEYFIRTLLDRPPDVRVVRPAGDRQVTPLEEVLIEARADDDFGVRSFDLVLQKPGEADVVVPFPGPRDGLTVNGRHMLFLEDLDVAPGDFVTYYVRASDVGRGKPSSESRSDIFFLEVKAFNDEFVAAQSQAMAAGAQSQGVQDLAAAQKEIVVATWKLDSRGRRASRAGSVTDIKALAAAQRALEQRAAKEAGNQLQAAGGPPRRRRGPATANDVGDDPMGLAIEAMRRAAAELDRLQVATALPHEKEALNQLLRAEAEVRRRQVARQQGGGGSGNRSTPDLSALFDQELRKQQQTNYETPASSETRQDDRTEDDPLAKLRELARRQEALSREQQDLARNQEALEAEALKRRLEKLTRDQDELRRQLEQLAREMPKSRDADAERREASSPSQAAGQREGQKPSGQQGQQGTPPGEQGGQPGQPGQRAGGGQGSRSGSPQSEQEAMRDAAAEMRQATSGLQQQDPAKASESAARAVERIRRAEEALRGSTADDLQRRLGDLQTEARQLADAERRLAAEMQRLETSGDTGSRGRQVAAEQDRLASRTERLGQQLRDLSRQARGNEGRSALDQAGRELASGRVAERMREAASTLKDAAATTGSRGAPAGASASVRPGAPGSKTDGNAPGAATAAAAIGADAARSLDRVADRLAEGRSGDPASGRLSDTLSQAKLLRERLEGVERSLEQLNARGQNARGGRDEKGQPRQPQPGQSGERGESATTNAEVARLQRQVAEQMRGARAQVESMGRAAPDMRGPSTPEDWQPSVSAPGTEAFKQDFARWESLKQNLLLALEKVERSMSDELRQEESRDRLGAGASDAVPDDYRRLVEKYYRSLAAPRQPER